MNRFDRAVVEICVSKPRLPVENVSVGLRRSEIDGYFKSSHLCPRDVGATLWQPIGSVGIVPDAFQSPAPIYDPNPIDLENASVGLRRSEIDGYF